MNTRVSQAIAQTQNLLDKALSYSVEFQKPAQITYYREHLAFLRGERTERAVADTANWDRMNNGAVSK